MNSMFPAFAPPLIPLYRTTRWNFPLPLVTHHCAADIGLFVSSQLTIHYLCCLCFSNTFSAHKSGTLLTRRFNYKKKTKKKATDETNLHVRLLLREGQGLSCHSAARYRKDSQCEFSLIRPCGVQLSTLLPCWDYFSSYPQLFNFSTILSRALSWLHRRRICLGTVESELCNLSPKQTGRSTDYGISGEQTGEVQTSLENSSNFSYGTEIRSSGVGWQ